MTRILLHRGELFDGTGEDPRTADVVIDGERIVGVGAPGTSGTGQSVGLSGRTMLPGLFDRHIHVLFSGMSFCGTCRRPDGTARKRITVDGGAAAWSPEASHIVEEFNLGGRRQIYIAGGTCRDTRPLVIDSDDDCCATWS